jgi:hypothetical protein
MYNINTTLLYIICNCSKLCNFFQIINIDMLVSMCTCTFIEFKPRLMNLLHTWNITSRQWANSTVAMSVLKVLIRIFFRFIPRCTPNLIVTSNFLLPYTIPLISLLYNIHGDSHVRCSISYTRMLSSQVLLTPNYITITILNLIK